MAEHDRAAVDVKVRVHGAAAVVDRMGDGQLGSEGAAVELGRLHGAVNLKVGDDAAVDGGIGGGRGGGRGNHGSSFGSMPVSSSRGRTGGSRSDIGGLIFLAAGA